MMAERFKVIAPVVGILIASICVVGLALAWLGVLPGFAREEETADGKAPAPTSAVQNAPADATDPDGTKTATFALG